MARGTESKQIITDKILNLFEGSFIYGKEIRIPMIEGGEQVQIKITLTAAKENVESGSDTAIPVKSAVDLAKAGEFNFEITKEEKEEVSSLINQLGL